MNLLKTLLKVGAAAGVGAVVGDKAYGLVSAKLPASFQRDATRIGFQAAGAVVTYALLEQVF